MNLDIESYLDRLAANVLALKALGPEIEQAAEQLSRAMAAGDKIVFCGNGGSAADCQHLAAELVGRFLVDRDPLPALSLTVDTSALTAIGNDYGFKDVFSRQLRAVGRRGDVLVALSTSGNSENVLEAARAAKTMGIGVVGLAGRSGGRLKGLCDVCVCVPSEETNHIQEMHIAVGHYLCGVIEQRASTRGG